MSRTTPDGSSSAEDGDSTPGVGSADRGASHLVTMANRIGDFFRHQGDEATARQGIAAHLHHFWAPSMRRDLIGRIDRASGSSTIDGATLDPLVRAAIEQHRAVLLSTRGRHVPGEAALLEAPPGGGDAG